MYNKMLSKIITDALNKQINAELYSSYLYLAMSSNLETQNLKGFAKWMIAQSNEERGHAMKTYNYLITQNEVVELDNISKPPKSWENTKNMFEEVYKHEQAVTRMIHSLMETAISEKDHATQSMLKWFVDEQVEEEATSNEILQKINSIKNDPVGLLLLDKELGERSSK